MSDKEPQQWMRDAAEKIVGLVLGNRRTLSMFRNEIAEIVAAHCPEKELGHGTERSDKDYAIEHAEYLAKAAESFLRVSNERAKAADEADSAEDLMNADESLNDHWRALESAIYEFRKRAQRAEVKSGKYPIARPSRMMISKGGEIHQECPDCRGECSPAACPRCGSGFKSVPLQVVAPEFFAGPVSTTVRVEMCSDSWHSSVATQKESK